MGSNGRFEKRCIPLPITDGRAITGMTADLPRDRVRMHGSIFQHFSLKEFQFLRWIEPRPGFRNRICQTESCSTLRTRCSERYRYLSVIFKLLSAPHDSRRRCCSYQRAFTKPVRPSLRAFAFLASSFFFFDFFPLFLFDLSLSLFPEFFCSSNNFASIILISYRIHHN